MRVAMIGYAFMGDAHSQAWRTAPHFFELPYQPQMQVVVGRNETAVAAAAAKQGWAEHATDWRAVIARDDIDIVDICTPGDTHAEIALAALAAGKHVMCEKPLANSVAEAEAMAAAARDAAARGVYSMCGFTYRRTPALTYARRLVEKGFVGEIRHIRGQYLQDWLSDADAPLTWRMDKAKAGSGALGDIGAHSIDAAQYVSGQRATGASGLLHTFVTSRPKVEGNAGLSGKGGSEGAERGPVTVDDAALFTLRFDGGALGQFEASRMALGRKNANRLEINGTRGSIAFDFEDMNSLHLYDGTAPAGQQGFTKVNVTEAAHPYTGNWWPVGHGLGYEHGFTHQVVDFLGAIAAGEQPTPSFDEALHVQRVLDAIEASSEAGQSWQSIEG
ncbi:Gfo/Idh/MocA family oxidoreductase [Micrococcales bacterium 31B]|nr:Gfo/Idh/MocA family oxidoreductase [Micrococcales bacterium 31B]